MNRRFTVSQIIIFGLWVGGPILTMLVLMLINPLYETNLFRPFPFPGILFVILLEALNIGVLGFGFWWINTMHQARLDAEEPSPRNVWVAVVALPSLVFFTLPALWLVVYYPAVVMLMTTRTPL